MNFSQLRPLLVAGALCWAASASAAEPPTLKSRSPDGRYALRLSAEDPDDARNIKTDIVEKATGKVVLGLGNSVHGEEGQTALVWSADSRWVAYYTTEAKIGSTRVFAWTGSAFEEVELPEKLPEPTTKVRKADEDAADKHSAATRPERWRKPGELEMTSDEVLIVRTNNRTYVGVVNFTISVDAQRKATMRNVGKTKTTVK